MSENTYKLVASDDNDHLILSGRIDATNSENFGKNLNEFAEKQKEKGSTSIVIDTDELKYISSAGLRILLRFIQKFGFKVTLDNVSRDVRDILEMTGLDTYLEVHQKLREVSVEGCEQIGIGASGTVYRLDADTIIKVFNENTRNEEIEQERKLAHESFIAGIPTAIAYDVVKVGNCKGTVFEMLDSKTLSEEMTANPDKFDDFAKMFTDLLKQVHSTRVDTSVFPSIKELYGSYFEGVKDWFNSDEMDKLKNILNVLPDSDTLIHGDYHPRNIMRKDDELMLIDMGNVSCGHPIFDFIAMSVSMPVLARASEELGEQFIQIPGGRIVPFWKKVLSLYFKVDDEKKIDELDHLFCTIGRLKRAVVPVVAAGAGDELIKSCVEDARTTLFGNYDEIMSTDWGKLFESVS